MNPQAIGQPKVLITKSVKSSLITLFTAHPVVTFVVAIAAICIPLFWDRYWQKTQLELRILNAAQLVNQEAFQQGFTVSHNGIVLDSLARVTMSLSNTGTKAIRKTDIVRQPSICFYPSSTVLTVQIDEDDSQKLSENIKISKSTVEVPIELLNPGEDITLSIFAQSTMEGILNPTPSARIEYLDSIKLVNLVDLIEAAGIRAAKERTWNLGLSFWVASGFGLLMLIITPNGISQLIQQRRLGKRLSGNPEILDSLTEAGKLRDFVRREMKFLPPSHSKELQLAINKYEVSGGKFCSAEFIHESLRRAIYQDPTTRNAVVGIIFLLIICLYFSVYHLYVLYKP